jgi:Transposase IS4
MGLPCFISFERKPDDGFEIWSCCCGRTGVMVQLKVVKTQTQQQEYNQSTDEINHGTKVVLSLILPWYGSDRLVCADSYFSSIQTALECKRVKMRCCQNSYEESSNESLIKYQRLSFCFRFVNGRR